MFKAFFWSGKREWSLAAWKHVLRAYLGAIGLCALVATSVWLATLYNHWHETFFDALKYAAVRPESALWNGLALFVFIISAEVVLSRWSKKLGLFWGQWWREAITDHFVSKWGSATGSINAASQRIQEDTMLFAELVEKIGLAAFRALLTLAFFIPILWDYGRDIKVGPFEWDGALITVAVGASVSGMALMLYVGRHLKHREYIVQDKEASWRKLLVHSEDARNLLNAGQGWSRVFEEVLEARAVLYRLYGHFEGWSTLFDKVMMILPIIICIPNLADGLVEMGVAMAIINAFGQVQGGFTFLLRSWTDVTKLQSVKLRLREFQVVLSAPSGEAIVTEAPAVAEVIEIAAVRREKKERDERRAQALAEARAADPSA
jgi:peptide/bleomycin uptake transporter